MPGSRVNEGLMRRVSQSRYHVICRHTMCFRNSYRSKRVLRQGTRHCRQMVCTNVGELHSLMCCVCRCSELLLSTPASKRAREPSISLRATPHHTISAAFSTSTPTRSQSPQSGISAFTPVATQILSQPPTTLAAVHNYPAFSTWDDMRPTESILEMEEEDAFQAARASFETRDFVHAIHILRDGRSAKSKFLNVYCQFIVSF